MARSRNRVTVEDWPRLTRFYGIPPKDLKRMPYALLEVYATALTKLHAEETLLAMTVSDMPHIIDKERKSIRRSFARWLGTDDDDTPKVDMRTEAGVKLAGSFGIGVSLPPAIESEEEPVDA